VGEGEGAHPSASAASHTAAAAAAGSRPLGVQQLVGASWEEEAAAPGEPAGVGAAGEEAAAVGAPVEVAPRGAVPWLLLLLQWPLTGWYSSGGGRQDRWGALVSIQAGVMH
jgi:hypothetical protein